MEIKENLGNIPNLIINFDETLTATDTITEIIKQLKKIDIIPDFERKYKAFTERLKLEKAGKLPAKDQRGKVQYFYEEVIRGLNKKTLGQVYDRISEVIELNPNFKEIINQLKQENTPVRLFVLSLNSNWLLKKYCEKHQVELEGVEIVGILGNQIKFDENGQVMGVYEHVTEENKKDFVPEGNVVLADNRETQGMLKAGVNAVNIQIDSYHEGLFATAREYLRFFPG